VKPVLTFIGLVVIALAMVVQQIAVPHLPDYPIIKQHPWTIVIASTLVAALPPTLGSISGWRWFRKHWYLIFQILFLIITILISLQGALMKKAP
jgi:hypothetical protein